VRQQSSTRERIRIVLPRSKNDIAAQRKRSRLQATRSWLSMRWVGVNAYVVEVGTKPRFEVTALGGGERLSAAAEHANMRGHRPSGAWCLAALVGRLPLDRFLIFLFEWLELWLFFATWALALDDWLKRVLPGDSAMVRAVRIGHPQHLIGDTVRFLLEDIIGSTDFELRLEAHGNAVPQWIGTLTRLTLGCTARMSDRRRAGVTLVTRCGEHR
jgi:hypothetical protein